MIMEKEVASSYYSVSFYSAKYQYSLRIYAYMLI